MTLAVLIPLVAAPLIAWLAPYLKRYTSFAALLAFVPALVVLARGPLVGGFTLEERSSWLSTLGFDLVFRLDGLSSVFVLLVAIVGPLTVIYATTYLSSHENLGRFYALLLGFAGAMLGLIMSGNLFLLVTFWELTSIFSFLLIGFWHPRPAARDGALKAFLVTAFGGLALLAASICIFIATNTAELSQLLIPETLTRLQAHPLFTPALLLVLTAAFTKSAQLPAHLWLPTAMEAPTPISAFLHAATMVKAGVYLIARFGPVFIPEFIPEGSASLSLWSSLCLGVGLATLVWGAWFALRQYDLKALLAYSTLSQLGLLIALYGLGEDASFVATLQLVNHAAFKAALFLITGVIDHETGTRNLRELRGLWRVLPICTGFALLAALSMAGLPPLAGFLSKELAFETLLEIHPAALVCAVIASAGTVAYSLKFLKVFFGPLKVRGPHLVHEPRTLWLPIAPLGLTALIFGLLPNALAHLITPIDGVDHTLALWHGITPSLIASLIAWGLGIVIFLLSPKLSQINPLERRFNANTLYYATIETIERFALSFTRQTQGQGLSRQLRVGLIFMLFASGTIILAGPWREQLPSSSTWLELGSVTFALLPVGALIIAGTLGVLLAHRPIAAILFSGLTGFGTAVSFLILSAPDLALTQVLVEAMMLILFLLALRFLPPMQLTPRRRNTRIFDAILALGIAVTLFLLLSTKPFAKGLSDFFFENALKAGGHNVLNIILVDFRGWDTLGEIMVLAASALGVTALVGKGAHPGTTQETPLSQLPGREYDPILRSVARGLFVLIIVFAAHFFFRGHNAPGGGFIAGLTVTAALCLYRVAFASNAMRTKPLRLIWLGLSLALGTAILPAIVGKAVLQSDHGLIQLGSTPFEWVTSAVFDLGVALTVVGISMSIVGAFTSLERDRTTRPNHTEELGDKLGEGLGGT